jgi:serine/threonine-protein kinase
MVDMADDSSKSNFLRIVYTKVKTNGQTELVPLKLYTDVPLEEITLPASVTTDAAIPVGTIVSNRYLIGRVLGQGGFGRTYLASDIHCFNKHCVLKEFLPNLIEESYQQKSRDLFEREAKILYQIDHPQIPKFQACFEDNKRLFLVQEYVEGKTYSALLRERISEQNKAFDETEIIQWLRDILPVLDYIHQHNIIHRDISPDNIILDSDKNLPVLIDFGVGKQNIEQCNPNQTYARQKSVVGKIGYAPHEQISLGQCFPSSDLYALGVTAIVLLTGIAPEVLLDGYSLEWQWQKYIRVSQTLAEVLNKMLADKPKERYHCATDVLNALGFPTLAGVTVVNQVPEKMPLDKQRVLFNSAFIELCQQELANCIGPIAGFLIQDILNKNPTISAQTLVEELVAQIPNGQQAIAFRHRLL